MIKINIKELIECALKYSYSSQGKVAALMRDKKGIPWTRQKISQRINDNTLTAGEFFQIIDELGIEFYVSNNNKKGEDGNPIFKASVKELRDKTEDWKTKASEFLEMLEMFGIDYKLYQPVGNFKIDKYIPGEGLRLRQYVKDHQKWCDTIVSNAISNTFYADGINRYDENGSASELYRDKDGDYFIANYFADHPNLDNIQIISEEEVAAYIAKNGVVKHKPE